MDRQGTESADESRVAAREKPPITARVLEDGRVDLTTAEFTGSEGERGFRINGLRTNTGGITVDTEGLGNTGIIESSITFIDGVKGILNYRGYPITHLVNNHEFLDVALLLLNGELPEKEKSRGFASRVQKNMQIDPALHRIIRSIPDHVHPMSIMQSVFSLLGDFHPELKITAAKGQITDEAFESGLASLLGKTPVIIAAINNRAREQELSAPIPYASYTENFLHLMFSNGTKQHLPSAAAKLFMDQFLTLHADHEQNCSTFATKVTGSSQASLVASIASGIGALSGPLHGGANEAVLHMLNEIVDGGKGAAEFIARAKTKDKSARLMGFGHRVYKSYDPRAKALKALLPAVLQELKIEDPRMGIATQLEEAALNDSYFIDRNLYPNVDFYAGMGQSAMGIPVELFTPIFAMGRMPGWVAQWKESQSKAIFRPRQIYVGKTAKDRGLSEA